MEPHDIVTIEQNPAFKEQTEMADQFHKITDETKLKIVKAMAEGTSITGICQRFGIGHQTPVRILKEFWRANGSKILQSLDSVQSFSN